MLYLCATPIGNLEDITIRVLRVLAEADLIAAEDTRHTRKLLTHYDIRTRLVSYHEHSPRSRLASLIDIMLQDKTIAFVSDAGTPAISDPGRDLVRACYEAGVKVTCCPGACALPTALALSSFSADEAVFEGFLPRDKHHRARRIESLGREPRTTVIYESPHRVAHLLRELEAVTEGGRKVAVLGELTKLHERADIGEISEILKLFEGRNVKGEFAVVLEGIGRRRATELESADLNANFSDIPIHSHVLMHQKNGLSKMQAIKAAAKERGVSKAVVYNAILESEGDNA